MKWFIKHKIITYIIIAGLVSVISNNEALTYSLTVLLVPYIAIVLLLEKRKRLTNLIKRIIHIFILIVLIAVILSNGLPPAHTQAQSVPDVPGYYYIGQWEWFTDLDMGLSYWRAPEGGNIGALDLRSLPQQAQKGVVEGYSVFVYDRPVNHPSFILLADNANAIVSNKTVNQLERLLDIPNLDGGSVADVVWDIIVYNGDPTGQTKWKPLRGSPQSGIKLALANNVVKYESFDTNHPAWPNTLAVFREDYKRNRTADILRGSDDYRRFLGAFVDKHNIAWELALTGTGLPLESPLPYSSTINDNFNRSGDLDSSTSSDGQFTWIEVQTNFTTTGTVAQAAHDDPSNAVVSARAEYDFADDAHYAQADLIWLGNSRQAGCATRFAAAAETYYHGWGNAGQDSRGIGKMVAGTLTWALTESAGTIDAGTLQGKLDSDSSDLHTFSLEGLSDINVTDTSITGNTRTGLFGYNGVNTIEYDNFEASDGGAVSLPTVTTQAATSIEDTTATGNGNITATGGENADLRGVVWDDATHGDPGNTAPASSDYVTAGGNYTSEAGSFGTGAFTASMTGLPTGTTIYYRAWAHNSAGYAYGGEQSFLTKPAAPTNVAATDGSDETKVVITWTKSTGATGYRVWRDAVDVSGLLGDVATYDDSGATAGTITSAGTATASDGTSTLHVTLSLSGEATGTTSHTYKVTAENATGSSGDSATDTGYRGVGAITYQWQVDSGGGYGNIVGATTDPYNYTGAGAPTITAGNGSASDGTSSSHVTLSVAGESGNNGSTWSYQCIVSASGASNSPQTSTNDTGYRGTDSLSYEWFRSNADADAGYASIAGEGGTTDPYNDTNGVVDPDGRWYYAEISMSGAVTQDTTHDRGYKSSVIGAPTNFVATYISSTQVTLTWLTGGGATDTYIRGKQGAYPDDRNDGYLVYDGVLETADDTTMNFSAMPSDVYYRGWGKNGVDYSDDYTETHVGGRAVVLLVFLGVALVLSYFAVKEA